MPGRGGSRGNYTFCHICLLNPSSIAARKGENNATPINLLCSSYYISQTFNIKNASAGGKIPCQFLISVRDCGIRLKGMEMGGAGGYRPSAESLVSTAAAVFASQSALASLVGPVLTL